MKKNKRKRMNKKKDSKKIKMKENYIIKYTKVKKLQNIQKKKN